MRKFPPAVATRRVAFKDYQIPNTKITLEKGEKFKLSQSVKFF